MITKKNSQLRFFSLSLFRSFFEKREKRVDAIGSNFQAENIGVMICAAPSNTEIRTSSGPAEFLSFVLRAA